jgi:hypothetical protein
LDLLVLADITLVLKRDGGEVSALTDDRVDKVALSEREYALSLRVDDPARDSALKAMKRAQLAMRNHPEGFFVAAADPAVAYQAYTDTMPLEGLREAAILSDGAAVVVSQMGLMSWAEMMHFLAGGGPESLIRKVRTAEHSDPMMQRWPRMKASDDATVAYIQL